MEEEKFLLVSEVNNCAELGVSIALFFKYKKITKKGGFLLIIYILRWALEKN